MASCDVPAANKSGFIITDDGLLSGPGISLSFTTDENGYFKITHTGKESMDKFTVRVQGSSDVLRVTNLSGNTKNLGKVYINPPSVNIYMKLKINNHIYNELDTLHYRNAGYPTNGLDPWLKIAGPFVEGTIDTIYNAVNPGVFPLSFGSNLIPEMRLDYYINNYDSWNDKFVYISTPHCSDEYQTITLVID
ncbi:MAG: hypothetical protein E6Q37_00835 [Crocinitomicaceae bacterium]|nr:MAG: hypothetical protein E6Q37_00835 [Crocinitomicaceae bacterium]